MAKPGPRFTRQYSDRIKATAVKLSYLSGVRMREFADSLYIHPFMLCKWRKQAREGNIVSKGIDLKYEVAANLKELRKMRKGYENLKREHRGGPGNLNSSISGESALIEA